MPKAKTKEKKAASEPEDEQQDSESKKKKVKFWDSWYSVILFVGVILVTRFWLFEPFKIPSGSMEPTLIGHEDYGDRIVTNKVAYGKNTDPERFDVVVFTYDPKWEDESGKTKNYIKRLVGLPNETIIISGGDLFLGSHGLEKIIRKWETDMNLQARLWQPYAKTTFKQRPVPEVPDDATPLEQLIRDVPLQENAKSFPWQVAQGKVELKSDRAVISGETTLTFAYQVDNIYVKMGRWPFLCQGCPMSDKPSILVNGIPMRDPTQTSTQITPYLPNSWSGVRCPNCQQLCFPLQANHDDLRALNKPTVKILPGPLDTPFFYGGSQVVGDLMLEIEFTSKADKGALELKVGSSLHYAGWIVSLGGTKPEPPEEKERHEVTAAPVLPMGTTHALSLAFVDGTVMAEVDGKSVEARKIPVKPSGRAKRKSIAQLRFLGDIRVEVTRLGLYRDLFHTMELDGGNKRSNRQRNQRQLDRENGRHIFVLREDEFMVLGDNSPSSKDSRVWGFVPREKLIGKATFIWWPPTRCRFIR